MSQVHPSPTLTEPQLAALAKIACGCETGGGIAVLVGPAGVGISTVLQALHDAQLGPIAVRSLPAWLAIDPQALPATVVLDDAHLETETDLARLLAHARLRSPAAALVLAGEGRLLTLIARDTRLEQAIRIRGTLLAGSLADTRQLVEAGLPPAATIDDPGVATLHEIAGGVPGSVTRLVELAAVVAAARPDGRVTAADIEAIHRRLSPLAA